MPIQEDKETKISVRRSHTVLLDVLVAGPILLSIKKCTSKKLGGKLMFIFGGSSPRYSASSKILCIKELVLHRLLSLFWSPHYVSSWCADSSTLGRNRLCGSHRRCIHRDVHLVLFQYPLNPAFLFWDSASSQVWSLFISGRFQRIQGWKLILSLEAGTFFLHSFPLILDFLWSGLLSWI